MKFNLCLFDQIDFVRGMHQSGWEYVMKHFLEHFHDPLSDIVFDAYVDRTFLFPNPEIRACIPYTQKWVGIIHHTYCRDVVYNSFALWQSPDFVSSLYYCQALLVFSMCEKKKWEVHLAVAGISVPIYVISHPTELNVRTWDARQWFNSKPRPIVQIGAWMRDTFAIYELNTPFGYQKFALQGPKMDGYYHSSTVSIEKEFKEYLEADYCETGCMCRDPCREPCSKSRYIQRALSSLVQKEQSVNVIDKLGKVDYDNLLSSSVVFLKLHDAGAVNTVLECIARNTPVIVNRVPALEELLGKDYPLFYDRMDQVYQFLEFPGVILCGFMYLVHMNKSHLTLQSFFDCIRRLPL